MFHALRAAQTLFHALLWRQNTVWDTCRPAFQETGYGTRYCRLHEDWLDKVGIYDVDAYAGERMKNRPWLEVLGVIEGLRIAWCSSAVMVAFLVSGKLSAASMLYGPFSTD